MELLIKHAHLIVDEKTEFQDIDLYIKDGKVIDYEDKKIGYIDIDVFSSVSYEQIKRFRYCCLCTFRFRLS